MSLLKVENDPMEPWIIRPKINWNARLRLICFPFTGGSASAFSKWPDLLPPDIELCAIQLPGRQKRLMEPPYKNIYEAIESLSSFLKPHLDLPLAIFGDCTGALLAFELCRSLRKKYEIVPWYLFVTCCRAPQLPYKKKPIYDLPDDQLKEEMVRLSVVPEWLRKNGKVFSAFLPLLRADFEMVETYKYTVDGYFNFPITVCAGKHDNTCDQEEINAWCNQTNAKFHIETLEGGHNLSETNLIALTNIISSDLESCLNH